MKRTDFSFDLPRELIAQHPAAARARARLMVIRRQVGVIGHHTVLDLPGLIPSLVPEGAVMVFNDSRVRKARIYGVIEGADKEREFLFLEDRSIKEGKAARTCWLVMSQRVKKLKEGASVGLPGNVQARVIGKADGFALIECDRRLDESYFDAFGHVPLPPYIDRGDAPEDEERYQTVYAKETGSVAAPTAGLHFTDELLGELARAGVEIEWVRLHVGIGTFLPVRVDNIEDHKMHHEQCEMTEVVASRLTAARRNGKKVIAVGTTSVRTLETAWNRTDQRFQPIRQETDLFIRPGYEFGGVDALFTNFHTPESTLLMLVSAFAGRDVVLSAYQEAVRRQYRFFSYGDATLFV